MTVVNNASVIFKDKNGNVGKVKSPSANDITKISTAISDVAQVVDPASHLPINATTSSVGVVQLADAAAVAAGTAGRIIDAAQLKDAIEHVTPAGNVMTTDTAQTVTAVKTFSSLPVSSVTPTANNQLTNKAYVDAQILANLPVPTSTILPYGSSTIPSGWLLCNGAAVSRITYAGLFAKVGTRYGAGDGSTTFNVPDMRDRYPIGVGTNALAAKIAEQLPNIADWFFFSTYPNDQKLIAHSGNTVFKGTSNTATAMGQPSGGSSQNITFNLIFDMSGGNSIYTNNGKVYPLSLALNFIIKA